MESSNTVVVIQSNYLPWKGYFDLIHDADQFIFHDDLQYTKNDWRNRNRIKTRNGISWITVPVGTNEHRYICEVEIADRKWQKKHWNMISTNYRRSLYFKDYKDFFEDVYLGHQWMNLSELNQYIVKYISKNFLKINNSFSDSREYNLSGKKLDRLLELMRKVRADRYISGPAAKDYIDQEQFKSMGIELVWKDYSNYPEYKQEYPPFEHNVSIIDLLFHTGPDAPWYIWGWRER